MQIVRCSSPDQLLQLRALCLTLLRLHLLGRLQVVGRVEHGGIFAPDGRELVALEVQQAVHVADEAQILAVLARLADGASPFFNQLEDLVLHAGVANGRPLGEASHELVQKSLVEICRWKG